MTKKVFITVLLLAIAATAIAFLYFLYSDNQAEDQASQNDQANSATQNNQQPDQSESTVSLEGDYKKSTSSDGAIDIYHPEGWYFYTKIEEETLSYSLLCEENQEPFGHEGIGYCLTVTYDDKPQEMPDTMLDSYPVTKQNTSSFSTNGYEGIKTLMSVQYDDHKEYRIYYEFGIEGKNLKVVATGPESTYEGKEKITDQIVQSIVVRRD